MNGFQGRSIRPRNFGRHFLNPPDTVLIVAWPLAAARAFFGFDFLVFHFGFPRLYPPRHPRRITRSRSYPVNIHRGIPYFRATRRGAGPNPPRANQGRVPPPPPSGTIRAPSPNQSDMTPAALTVRLTSTRTTGTATTGRTISAITLTILSSTAASSTLARHTATASSASTAIITASGFRVVSPLKWLLGTGPSALIGAGTAPTISSSMRIPSTSADICSTTFILACTSTSTR